MVAVGGVVGVAQLHMGMISNHRLWARFLRRLRFVVIDEAHISYLNRLDRD